MQLSLGYLPGQPEGICRKEQNICVVRRFLEIICYLSARAFSIRRNKNMYMAKTLRRLEALEEILRFKKN
jgi:hypothetical protein